MTLGRREFLVAGLAAGTATACGFFGDDDGPRKIDYGDAPSQFGELRSCAQRTFPTAP